MSEPGSLMVNGGEGQDRPPHTRRTPDRRVSGELFQMESGEGEDRTHDTWFFRPVLYHYLLRAGRLKEGDLGSNRTECRSTLRKGIHFFGACNHATGPHKDRFPLCRKSTGKLGFTLVKEN